MPVPEHPETVIIKNNFYPSGLNERNIWDFYQKNKNRIIKEIGAKPVLLWITIDMNTTIVKRKIFNQSFTITEKNYDKIITGRTLSISSELDNNTNIFIIDIDPGPTALEPQIKDATKKLLDSPVGNLPYISNTRVISTSKGYHIHFIMKKKMNITTVRKVVLNMLNIEFRGSYLINEKNPKGSEINFDLTPTTIHGGHQVPFALCRNGLQALDVTGRLETFDRRSAIII